MDSHGADGRALALGALSGRAPERVLLAPVIWGFDYVWQIAGLEPWQLAFGGDETWHRAHLAMLERHGVDLLFYQGVGSGPEEPTLLGEDRRAWRVRDGNSGAECDLLKGSLTPYRLGEGAGDDDAATTPIASTADVDRLIPEPAPPGARYLRGLTRLIHDAGQRALVLPLHSPAYIIACYALGFERAMEAMLREPDLLLYACERIHSGELQRMQRLAEAGAEAVYVADSWASCDIISPAMFERFALPYQRATTEAAHEAGLRVILWNLGDIAPILHLEADLPVDAFAFEQPRKGFAVSVTQVRAAFGPARCLFGNLDSEMLLLRNDPEEIAEAVARQLRQSGEGAPFVLSTGSPLPSNVDPSAVDRFLTAARVHETR